MGLGLAKDTLIDLGDQVVKVHYVPVIDEKALVLSEKFVVGDFEGSTNTILGELGIRRSDKDGLQFK